MLLELLGSSGFGALTGGLFGWLGKKEERKNLEMQLKHEIELMQTKTDSQIKLTQANINLTKAEAQSEVEKSEARAFEESQKVISGFAENLKSVIRPAILGVLMYQTWILMTSLETLTGGLESLPAAEVLALYKVVVLSITGLTSVGVGWYFSQRTSKQFDRLLDLFKQSKGK